MKPPVSFFLPDPGLVAIWLVIAAIACGTVLWTGRLFQSTRAALAAAGILLVLAAAPLIGFGSAGIFYLIGIVLPAMVGTLAGLAVWHFWLGQVRARTD